jgi:hypothetical protein
LARSVRAKFSKKLGGFTDYSNTVTVTPDKIDPTDTTAPAKPYKCFCIGNSRRK